MAWNYRSKSKFGANKVDFDGRSFASKFEAAVYGLLKLREAAGEIKDIQCQAQVELSEAAIIYKPDFKFIDCATGETVYAEAKGFKTPEWKLKLRLWRAYGPGNLHIYEGSYTRPRLTEVVIPKTSTIEIEAGER